MEAIDNAACSSNLAIEIKLGVGSVKVEDTGLLCIGYLNLIGHATRKGF